MKSDTRAADWMSLTLYRTHTHTHRAQTQVEQKVASEPPSLTPGIAELVALLLASNKKVWLCWHHNQGCLLRCLDARTYCRELLCLKPCLNSSKC